jgi:SPP1 gp7 family putative phage head morphogenesis protein
VKKKDLSKKSMWGVSSFIRKYEKLIKNIFFDEALLKEMILKPNHQESLTSAFTLYLEKIAVKIQKASPEVLALLSASFIRGGKRTFDKKGKPISTGEVKDKRGLDELFARQQIIFKNLTKTQSLKVMQVISEGREKGLGVKNIAEQIVSEVRNVSEVKAKLIARTEIVRSHNAGQVRTLVEAGIEEYDYLTAGDERVSPVCSEYGRGGPYKVSLAGSWNNPLPVQNSHPNCRCTVVAR